MSWHGIWSPQFSCLEQQRPQNAFGFDVSYISKWNINSTEQQHLYYYISIRRSVSEFEWLWIWAVWTLFLTTFLPQNDKTLHLFSCLSYIYRLKMATQPDIISIKNRTLVRLYKNAPGNKHSSSQRIISVVMELYSRNPMTFTRKLHGILVRGIEILTDNFAKEVFDFIAWLPLYTTYMSFT